MKFRNDKWRRRGAWGVARQVFAGPPSRILHASRITHHSAFTLIEIMVVVGILLIVMATGIPTIMGGLKKEGMRKAVNDVVEVCRRARSQAIINGVTTEARFRPQDGNMEAAGYSAQLPDSVMLEMLDVNLIEYKDADEARVRFYPNGTCDELTVILHSDQNEWRKISLEITTGLASVGAVR